MPTCAQYIEETKRCFGDAGLSDQKLGDEIGFAQQTIAQSKRGRMSDRVALAIGSVLVKHGVIEHAGEVLLVAHAERDADPIVRKTLLSYAKNVLAVMSESAALEPRGDMAVATGAVQLSRAAPRSTGWRRRRDSNP